MNTNRIQQRLHTEQIGRLLQYHESVDSTNRLAEQAARDGAAHGTVIVAGEQTAGRGRFQRLWHSPPGLGLWFSILVRPNITAAEAPTLSLLTGLALAQALEDLLPVQAQLKWPNDLLLKNKKTAGILLDLSSEQNQIDYIVIGVGINVSQQPADFPEEVRDSATSLAIASGKTVDFDTLLIGFLETFERLYHQFLDQGFTPFVEPYQDRCTLLGHEVSITVGDNIITGEVIGLQPSGAMVIFADGQETAVFAGEVTRVR